MAVKKVSKKVVKPVKPIKKAVAKQEKPKAPETETITIGKEEAGKLAEKIKRVDGLNAEKQRLVQQLMSLENMISDAEDALLLKRMRLEESHKIKKERQVTYIHIQKGTVDLVKESK